MMVLFGLAAAAVLGRRRNPKGAQA